MVAFLSKEYSAPKGDNRSLLFCVLFGLFVAGFLVFFKPYDLSNAYYADQPLTLAFFGILSAIALIIWLYLLPIVFPRIFDDKQWKVWHQIVLLFLAVFTISTLNGLYLNYLNQMPFSWSNYGWIIIRTFAIAIIPICIYVLIDYNRKLKQHLDFVDRYTRTSLNVNSNKKTSVQHTETEDQVRINDNQDVRIVKAVDIIYMEADGNYLTLFTSSDDDSKKGYLNKRVFRTSLSKTEQGVALPYLIRCHRSYIVNLNKIKDVSGNAQGLKLHMAGTSQIVPVSRNYIKAVKAYLEL